MKRLLCALIALSAAAPALTSAAHAGQVTQIAQNQRCVETLRAGDALLKGIHTGALPHHVFIKRCDTLWMALEIKGGAETIRPIEGRYIPKFKARSKPFATPDARVTVGRRNIQEAWLTRPTRRYDHAILGDNIEAGGLAATDRRGRRVEIILPKGEVFEDRYARLVDLDGDGKDEIVTVHTYLDKGAALAVYAPRGLGKDERIVRLAESAPIGKPHRWLNPAVASDFDNDGNMEIAWVETPHIGGVLKVARLEGAGDARRLKVIAQLPGFSNHQMGSSVQQQAVTFDWDGDGHPDIILPDAARKAIKVVSLKDGKLTVIDTMPIGGIIDSPIVAADLNRDGQGEALLVTKDARLLMFTP